MVYSPVVDSPVVGFQDVDSKVVLSSTFGSVVGLRYVVVEGDALVVGKNVVGPRYVVVEGDGSFVVPFVVGKNVVVIGR